MTIGTIWHAAPFTFSRFRPDVHVILYPPFGTRIAGQQVWLSRSDDNDRQGNACQNDETVAPGLEGGQDEQRAHPPRLFLVDTLAETPMLNG